MSAPGGSDVTETTCGLIVSLAVVLSRMRRPILMREAMGSVVSGRSGAKENYDAAAITTGHSVTS